CLVSALFLAVVPRWGRAGSAAAVLAAVLVAAASVDWHAARHWVVSNAQAVDQDAEDTKGGVLLHQATPPDTTIAVVTARAIPYYAERQSIDIRGKNDRHVANLEPRGPLYPGHNKWDYDYSIGRLRPDVVVQLWTDPPSAAQMRRWGYVPVGYL